MNYTRNLTQQPPRSPRHRLGGYAIAARMIDKGRAEIAGTAGEYHFACPLDKTLLEFRGVTGDEVKALLATGANDEQVIDWLHGHGGPKTAAEIEAWSSGVEARRPYEHPERREWFVGECARLGLPPEASTLFDYLEADDAVTFKHS